MRNNGRVPSRLYLIIHEDGSRCVWRGGITDTGVAESLKEVREARVNPHHCPGGRHKIISYVRMEKT